MLGLQDPPNFAGILVEKRTSLWKVPLSFGIRELPLAKIDNSLAYSSATLEINFQPKFDQYWNLVVTSDEGEG